MTSERGHVRRRAASGRAPGPFFDFRQENGAWSIRDTRQGTAAMLGGVPQVGLGLAEAEELTAILNRLEAQRAAAQAGRESGD